MTIEEPIQARAMRPGDGTSVVDLWKNFLPDSEDWRCWLPKLLDDLLEERAIIAGAVFSESGDRRCVAAGITCFVSEDVSEAFILRPRPYLNRELLTRYRDGDKSVFLAPKQQAMRNAGHGLEMFVLEYCQENFDFDDPWAHQILNAIVPIYIEAHSGFNIRSCLHETEISVGHVQEAGGNPFLFEVSPQDPFSMSALGRGPRGVYGVSRDKLTAGKATGIAKSILFSPKPKLQLVLQEQEVIQFAFEGLTDADIAKKVGVSRDRIRQVWRGIYAHLEDCAPDFFASLTAPVEGTKRGGEKRRLTIAHLRNRPEELRPFALRRV